MRWAAMLLALTTAAHALPRTSLAQAGAAAQMLPGAEATAQCAPLGEAFHLLAKRYGERVFRLGQAADGVTMLITERPDTRSWTLLAVHGGEACMVGAGGIAGAWGA